MRYMPIVLLALLLAGCGSSVLQVDRKAVEVQNYHPPRPVPINPIEFNVKVLTYETTTALNEEVDAGTKLPYSYAGVTTQDYLTLGQWMQDALRYIRQLNAIIDFYEGVDPPEDEDEVEVEDPP